MAWGMHGGLQETEGPGFNFGGTRPSIEQRETDKIGFYLGENSQGISYESSPFDLKMGITPDARIGRWGMTLNPENQPDWLNAEVGVQGHGTSGQISPWGNLRVSPIEGLNFNVRGQRFPGMNFNLVSPSVSYEGQFKHPLDKWVGPLHVNADQRLGQEPTGMLSVRGDF